MWRLAILTAFSLMGAPPTATQPVSPGKLLVAAAELPDSNFAETVILIVQHDPEKGTVGLILNRRTKISLSRIFPAVKAAKADPIYLGGPIEVTSGQAVLRAPAKTDEATRLFGDVYVSASKEVIEKSVTAGAAASKFRLYLGYAGWAPGQLEAEIKLKAWSVVARGAETLFDDDPDTLWSRLSRESKRDSQIQVARASLPVSF